MNLTASKMSMLQISANCVQEFLGEPELILDSCRFIYCIHQPTHLFGDLKVGHASDICFTFHLSDASGACFNSRICRSVSPVCTLFVCFSSEHLSCEISDCDSHGPSLRVVCYVNQLGLVESLAFRVHRARVNRLWDSAPATLQDSEPLSSPRKRGLGHRTNASVERSRGA